MVYQNPAATVDIIVFSLYHNKTELLLIERKRDPFKGSWALPGGFIRANETFLQAAYRELKEETNLSGTVLNPVKVFDKVDRDPRGRTITMAFWTITNQRSKAKGGSDAALARWFPIRDLPALAFDHQEIIQATIEHMSLLYHASSSLLQGARTVKIEQLEKLLQFLL